MVERSSRWCLNLLMLLGVSFFFFEPGLLSLDVAPCWTVHAGEY